VKIKAGQGFYANISATHHDRDEWHCPEEYVPDRFDSRSKYFIRPDGKPRNPLSFLPFTTGKRVCIGKTFTEVLVRFTVPMILYHFSLELSNKEDLKKPKL